MDPENIKHYLEAVCRQLLFNIDKTASLVDYDIYTIEAYCRYISGANDMGFVLNKYKEQKVEMDLLQQSFNICEMLLYKEGDALCESYKKAISLRLAQLNYKQIPEVKDYFYSIEIDLEKIKIDKPENDGKPLKPETLLFYLIKFYDQISRLVSYFTSINCYCLGVESAKQSEKKTDGAQQS